MGDAAPSEAALAALESSDAATPLPAEALNTAMGDAAPSEAAPAALELPAEATPLADEKKVDGLPPPPSLRIFSGCFVALFTAFLVLQQFLTSVLGTTGFWVLVAIYGAFFAGTLVSPSVCRRLGLKASMVASAAAYATLHVVVAAAADGRAPGACAVAAGGACGVGAAVLWTAQGAYCAAVERRDGFAVERCQSYFWGRFSTAGCFGFGAALLLIGGAGLGAVAVLWAAALASWAAVAVFAAALPPLAASDDAADDVALGEKLARTLALFSRRDVQLKAASFVHLGAQEGLYWGCVTARMSPALIATSFVVHGALSASCCVATGWDWRGASAEAKALALAGVSVAGLAATAAGLARDESESSAASAGGLLLLVGTACFGLSDFPAHSLLRGSVGRAFHGSPLLEASMANVIFCLTVGNIAFFVAGPLVDPVRQALAVLALGLLSAGGLVVSMARAPPPAAAVALPLHK